MSAASQLIKKAAANPRQQVQIDQDEPEVIDEKGNPVSEGDAPPKTLTVSRSLARAMTSGLNTSSVVKSRLVSSIVLSTNGSQTAYGATNAYTDFQALGEFTNFQALFREFRFSGIRLTYLPFTPYKVEATINTSGRPLVIGVDPEDASTPSSFLQLWANVATKVGVSQNDIKFNWRNPDKKWYSTFSTTNPLQPSLAIKFAMDASAGVSIQCGALLVEYLVEFRARL